jgi:hypothetical protein
MVPTVKEEWDDMVPRQSGEVRVDGVDLAASKRVREILTA